jgi:hypothetical protein
MQKIFKDLFKIFVVLVFLFVVIQSGSSFIIIPRLKQSISMVGNYMMRKVRVSNWTGMYNLRVTAPLQRKKVG